MQTVVDQLIETPHCAHARLFQIPLTCFDNSQVAEHDTVLLVQDATSVGAPRLPTQGSSEFYPKFAWPAGWLLLKQEPVNISETISHFPYSG